MGTNPDQSLLAIAEVKGEGDRCFTDSSSGRVLQWTGNFVWTEMDKVSKVEDQIRVIIAQDDKDEFTSFLEESPVINSGNLVKLKFGESEFCPYKLLGWICKYRAVHCGTALVEGKTGFKVDLNLPIDGGTAPLHQAASYLSAGLVELFLRHGAGADVKCSAIDLEKHGLLPLHIAVERVSSAINLCGWTPKQSIFKLIIIICLPKMEEALETIRLLVQDTKEVMEVIRCYAKAYKLIELAILIVVAHEKFKEPITFYSEDGRALDVCTTFRECVKAELAGLIEFEYGLMSIKEEKKLLLEIKKRKAMMTTTLLMLEIFERAGADIGAYVQSKRANVPNKQVAQEIAGLLTKVGFTLKSKDTDLSNIIDGFPIELVLQHSEDPLRKQDEKSEEPLELESQQQDAPVLSFSQNAPKPSSSQPLSFSHRNVIRTHFPGESSVALHPFYPSWISKAGFCSGIPKIMKVQVKERSTGIEHYVQNFPSSKRCFSILLAVKRGIRGI